MGKDRVVATKNGKPMKLSCPSKKRQVVVKEAWLQCKNSKKRKFQAEYTQRVQNICNDKDSCRIGFGLNKKQKKKNHDVKIGNKTPCKKRKKTLHVKYRCEKDIK